MEEKITETYTKEEKSLTKLIQEWVNENTSILYCNYEEKNIKFCVRGCNCYQYEHEGTVITKFSGKSEFVRTNMALGDIFNCSEEEIELKDIFKLDGYFLDKLEKEKYKNEKCL